jgi:hypothetical protein
MNKKLFYYPGFAVGVFYLLRDIVGSLITPNYNYIKNIVVNYTKNDWIKAI